MKFKVGDLVVVKDPTPYLDIYSIKDNLFLTDNLFFTEEMRRYINGYFIIKKIECDGYKLAHLALSGDRKIGHYVWHESWLERRDIGVPNEFEDIDENTIDFSKLI
jgi:hypothetical protein